ncbi:methyl-accepting chemotaxis protein [Paraferrimonas sp. SM1919]|uniref:HAMP domain-containing methyl-accepting chemotaxis protein n=1 Tax=Paraferrimonas sp. SM1919 TaxID=2662263 RepID=UPI0013D2BD1F|nr:methyl-accepting chemotaxis protein [Paraferrimonas sp. SM1919]
MRLKLTVAVRIIAGFAAIALMLLISGIVSLSNISTIESGTQQIQNSSLPALKSSTQLMTQLAQQERIRVAAQFATTTDNINILKQQLTLSSSAFNDSSKQLTQLVANQDSLTDLLSSLSQSSKQQQEHLQQFLALKMQSLDNLTFIEESSEMVQILTDQGSSLLISIMNNADKFSNRNSQKAYTLSEDLDDNFFSLLSDSQEMLRVKTVEDLEDYASEILFLLESIDSNTSKLVELDSRIVTSNISKELVDIVNKLNSLVGEQGQINQYKHQQIDFNAKILEQSNSIGQLAASNQVLLETLQAEVELNSITLNEETLASADSARLTSWLFMLLAIIAAIGIAYYIISSILHKLNVINDALEVYTKGDLSFKLEDLGEDEFGHLGENITKLINALTNLIKGIQDRANQLATAAEETSAITAQSSSGVQQQKYQVEQAASATTQLSSSAQQVSVNANDALGEIKQADEEASYVQEITEQTKLTILSLADEVAKASLVINTLHDDSAEIGKILDVIRGIAEQTNLLALNAAIEAARAGEQGRGFAVVADEVRSLASRTQASTQEIQQMIEKLQTGAEQAVQVMEAGRRSADSCVEKSEQATTAVEAINNSVHKAFSAGTHIAQAADEQNKVSSEISEKLEQIASISEEASLGANQTEQSSQQVAQLAEELQASVKEFKL